MTKKKSMFLFIHLLRQPLGTEDLVLLSSSTLGTAAVGRPKTNRDKGVEN